ncbi:MAG: hypothetical protein IAI48_00545 [Candidatus Eremiobacteraeota bacterium]|nr:hypothetical protein [Candidatus Eremiobacteraeota bacterium]
MGDAIEPRYFENVLAAALEESVTGDEAAVERYQKLAQQINQATAAIRAQERDPRMVELAERLSPIFEAAQKLKPSHDYAANLSTIFEAAQRIPNFGEMIDNSALTMAHRLRPGRPSVPVDQRAKPVGISLSKTTRDQLETLSDLTGKTRSEIVSDAVALWADLLVARGPEVAPTYTYRDALADLYPGPLTAALTGAPLPPLAPEEADRATAIANQALNAWISPERTLDEVGAAMETFYAAAIKAVRLNR